MRFVDLAQHLHELRAAKTNRSIGSSMSVAEVWSAAIDCPKNGISKIYYRETTLPRPFDGVFFRLYDKNRGCDFGVIFVDDRLDKHWKEFVAIKEMMHCWSPGKTYVATPTDAADLVSAMNSKGGRYTSSVAADNNAIWAAAEVILPHFTVEREMKLNNDIDQIAFEHNLHAEIAQMICSIEALYKRKNGSL